MQALPTLEKAAAAESRRFLIDALNVAYWCGAPPSLRLPLALMRPLLVAGHEVLMIFDASAPHQLRGEAALYEQLMQQPTLAMQMPSGRSADGELLRRARAGSACIISRDGYRDHRRRYRKLIDEPGRVCAGYVAADQLLLPSLPLSLPLPATAEAAWLALQALLVDTALG
ncbi:MAG: hypothetical protein V4650_13590 [Pseudomonadota bacterium]